MLKWFEQVEEKNSNIVCSKVRLARNWSEYVFPSKLSKEQSQEMLARLNEGLQDLGDLDERDYESAYLDELSDYSRGGYQCGVKWHRPYPNTSFVSRAPSY